MLAAVVPLQDLSDRGLEIVVDGAARHAVPEREGLALSQEEGLLPLGGEHLQKHRPREAQPPDQERHGAQLASDLDGGLPEVELRPLPGSERQGHVGRSSLLLCSRARGTLAGVRSTRRPGCPGAATRATCAWPSIAAWASSAATTRSLGANRAWGAGPPRSPARWEPDPAGSAAQHL